MGWGRMESGPRAQRGPVRRLAQSRSGGGGRGAGRGVVRSGVRGTHIPGVCPPSWEAGPQYIVAEGMSGGSQGAPCGPGLPPVGTAPCRAGAHHVPTFPGRAPRCPSARNPQQRRDSGSVHCLLLALVSGPSSPAAALHPRSRPCIHTARRPPPASLSPASPPVPLGLLWAPRLGGLPPTHRAGAGGCGPGWLCTGVQEGGCPDDVRIASCRGVGAGGLHPLFPS